MFGRMESAYGLSSLRPFVASSLLISSGPGCWMAGRRYLPDKSQRISVNKTNYTIYWIVIYPLKSVAKKEFR